MSPSLLKYRPCAVAATCCGVKPTFSANSLLQVSSSLPSLSKMATHGLAEREVTMMRSFESTTMAQPRPYFMPFGSLPHSSSSV